MPIHEIRYRTWQGELTPQWKRLLSIPKFTLMSVWNKWATMALFSGGLQFLVYTGYLILITNPLVQELVDIEADQLRSLILADWKVFANFYLVQFFICLFLCLVMAPKMISTERANKALPLLYSRPITRWQYIRGKFFALALPLSLITWIEAVAIFVVMMLTYQPYTDIGGQFWDEFWTQSIWIGVGSIVIGMLLTITMSMFFLACSAGTTNYMYATAIPLAIIFGTSMMTQFIQNFMPIFPDLGLRDLQISSTYLMLEPGENTDISPVNVAVGYLTWIGLSIGFMLWRLRPVDVYND